MPSSSVASPPLPHAHHERGVQLGPNDSCGKPADRAQKFIPPVTSPPLRAETRARHRAHDVRGVDAPSSGGSGGSGEATKGDPAAPDLLGARAGEMYLPSKNVSRWSSTWRPDGLTSQRHNSSMDDHCSGEEDAASQHDLQEWQEWQRQRWRKLQQKLVQQKPEQELKNQEREQDEEEDDDDEEHQRGLRLEEAKAANTDRTEDSDEEEEELDIDNDEAKLERIRQLEEKGAAAGDIYTDGAYYDHIFRDESFSGSFDSDEDDDGLLDSDRDRELHESVTNLGRRLEELQRRIDAEGEEDRKTERFYQYDAAGDLLSRLMLLLGIVSLFT